MAVTVVRFFEGSMTIQPNGDMVVTVSDPRLAGMAAPKASLLVVLRSTAGAVRGVAVGMRVA